MAAYETCASPDFCRDYPAHLRCRGCLLKQATEQRDELLAALRQVRDFYLNADSAWRFSEGFDIDAVCRAIAKAEGEPYPPFEGTDVMDGDEDRT